MLRQNQRRVTQCRERSNRAGTDRRTIWWMWQRNEPENQFGGCGRGLSRRRLVKLYIHGWMCTTAHSPVDTDTKLPAGLSDQAKSCSPGTTWSLRRARLVNHRVYIGGGRNSKSSRAADGWCVWCRAAAAAQQRQQTMTEALGGRRQHGKAMLHCTTYTVTVPSCGCA
jgi:hypothetical protein